MDIWEIDKLVLFIAFVIPGFISLKVYNLISYGNKIKSSDSIVDAVAYSSINYAILFMPIWLMETSSTRSECPVSYGLFYFMVLFVFPIIWALLWHHLRKSDLFQNKMMHPTLKPWDFVFSQRRPYWIKVTLKNGTVIAGKYGEKSFTSSHPEEEQIYLEETWLLNNEGGFNRPKERTSGIIIMSSEILYVELLKYEEN